MVFCLCLFTSQLIFFLWKKAVCHRVNLKPFKKCENLSYLLTWQKLPFHLVIANCDVLSGSCGSMTYFTLAFGFGKDCYWYVCHCQISIFLYSLSSKFWLKIFKAMSFFLFSIREQKNFQLRFFWFTGESIITSKKSNKNYKCGC